MSRYILKNEHSIEVRERIDCWHCPTLQFDVSEKEYKRFIPGARVTITYREHDGEITIIDISCPY